MQSEKVDSEKLKKGLNCSELLSRCGLSKRELRSLFEELLPHIQTETVDGLSPLNAFILAMTHISGLTYAETSELYNVKPCGKAVRAIMSFVRKLNPITDDDIINAPEFSFPGIVGVTVVHFVECKESRDDSFKIILVFDARGTLLYGQPIDFNVKDSEIGTHPGFKEFLDKWNFALQVRAGTTRGVLRRSGCKILPTEIVDAALNEMEERILDFEKSFRKYGVLYKPIEEKDKVPTTFNLPDIMGIVQYEVMQINGIMLKMLATFDAQGNPIHHQTIDARLQDTELATRSELKTYLDRENLSLQWRLGTNRGVLLRKGCNSISAEAIDEAFKCRSEAIEEFFIFVKKGFTNLSPLNLPM